MMADAAWAVGIDVGGTKIAAGLVDLTTGEVLAKHVVPTQPGRMGSVVLSVVAGLAQEMLTVAQSKQLAVQGIGVGVCELVDLQGNVTSDFTVAWKGIPVQGVLSQLAPTVVEADVRAHALAEARYGAGRTYDLFAFIAVGTGISSCWVQHGVPFAGARGNALVLSTAALTVPLEDGNGTVNHVLETYASGPALAQRYGRGASRAEAVFAAAEAGDVHAEHVLRSAGASLGNSVAFLANVLDPEAIVVGGGLGAASGLYWDSFVEATRQHIWSEDTKTLPIVQASLGPDAGLIGAASSVEQKIVKARDGSN